MRRSHSVNGLLACLFATAMIVSSATAAAPPQQIPLPLTVNEVAKGEIDVLIAGEDIYARPSDLEHAGLTGASWNEMLTAARQRPDGHVESNGADFIALRSLAPRLAYKFDEANLTLSLTAAPELLASTSISVMPGRPANILYSHDTSTFLNYALTAGGGQSPGFFAESGTSIGGKLLLNSVSKSANQGLTRLLSSYSIDDLKRLRRWTYGDANVSSDSLGANTLMGGATVSRNFGLDPYFIRFSPLDFRGTALTPSRVDIYVNGAIVSQQHIPPGPFELRNIPVSAGAGNAVFVVRDVFGREQTMASPFYYSTDVLGKGISEYVYSAGFVRDNFGVRSFDYGSPAVIGFHRIGVTEDLTLGGRLEASRDVVSGGPRATKRTHFGDFGLAVASSVDHSRAGFAAELGYRYLGRRFSFGGTERFMSRQYANVSLRPANDRPLADLNAFLTMLMGRASFSLLWSRTNLRDSADFDSLSLLTNFPLGRRASVFASIGTADQGQGRRPQAFAGVSFLFGANTSANISVDHREGKTQLLADVQKSIGVGTGYGYRLQAAGTGGDHSGSGAVQYQNDFGRYEIGFNPFDSSQKPSVTAAGGIVYQKGSVLPTRPVQDSFALIRIPGVRNVRVYASNLPIGRTDRNGDLLVPNLLSYYGNRLSIEDRDVPLDYEVLATERVVAPPFRGGAFVEFPVRQIRTVTGSVVIGNDKVPAYGQITVGNEGASYVSPLGRGGEFYLENVPAGSYPATIEYKEGICTFTLQIPAGTSSVVKLGRLSCNEAKTP
ncbi:MAG: outer rane usher protein [Thermoanaerobaculia bacterium]|nr:outer rane usher protein [Thermoanaerobaculia bacterium]